MPDSINDHPGSRRRVMLGRAAVTVVVVGALAIVAAVVGEPTDRGSGLGVGFPYRAFVLGVDALSGALLALAGVMAVLVVWALATAPRRRPPRQRPWWHIPVVMAALGLVTLALALWIEYGWLGERLSQMAQERAMLGELDRDAVSGPEPADPVDIDPSLRDNAALAGALFVLLAGGAGLVWLLRGSKDEQAAPPWADEGAESLVKAVEVALDDLESCVDPREAILRCYVHLSSALADAGIPRRSSETAREHRVRAAAMLGPAGRAASSLVDRFERARYDIAPVGESDRREAVTALHEVRAALKAAREAEGGTPGPVVSRLGGGSER